MKMKNWMRNAGFTLVELIVVIAVLGILGAGAAVGYSGYVKKANKAADQQMVAEIVYALELAAISDPSSVPGDATLFLDTTGAQVTGSDSAGMSAALENAYGSNFGSQLKLQYGQWGLGSTVTAQAQKLVANANYEGGLSYTDDVDKLWGEVETILTGLESTETMSTVYGGSAGLMASAGARTVSDSGTTMENFAALWCNMTYTKDASGEVTNTGTFDNFGKDYDGTAKKEKENLDPMLAKCAAIKARNYAFGNWIINNYPNDAGMQAAAAKIQNANSGMSVGGTHVPIDFAELLRNPNGDSDIVANQSTLNEAVKKYFGVTTDYGDSANGFAITGAAADPTITQAYRDAMGYYTLMSAVNEAASETSGMDNDTYKKTMAAAVHNTGVLLNDPTMLTRIQGGCVAITVRDGSIWVTPQEIYIGGSDVGNGVGKSTAKLNDTVTVTVDVTDDGVVCTPDGNLVLKVGTQGKVVLKASEDYVFAEGETEEELLREVSVNAEHNQTVYSLDANTNTITALRVGESKIYANEKTISIKVVE